jgi:hypothetical protein
MLDGVNGGEDVSLERGFCMGNGIAHALRNPNVQNKARKEPNTQVHP